MVVTILAGRLTEFAWCDLDWTLIHWQGCSELSLLCSVLCKAGDLSAEEKRPGVGLATTSLCCWYYTHVSQYTSTSLCSSLRLLNIPRRILYFTYRPILYKKVMSWFVVHLEATSIGNQTDCNQQSFIISQYFHLAGCCTWLSSGNKTWRVLIYVTSSWFWKYFSKNSSWPKTFLTNPSNISLTHFTSQWLAEDR
jgi:hypothetical protein